MTEFDEKTMTAFDFVVAYRNTYKDKATKYPRLCGIYTATMEHFRAILVAKALCSSEEEQIIGMMVRECRIIKELAIQNGVTNSK